MRLLLFVAILFSINCSAQCLGPFNGASNCDPGASQITVSGNSSVNFEFDSFSKINGGLIINGSSIIKVRTVNNPAQTCKWNLIMYVNNGGGITPPNEWETLTTYGSGVAPKPPLNLLEVRVSNACGTPINNSVWQSFPAVTGSPISIINDITNPGLNFPGTCSGTQVNTQGSYLSNYGEYTFTIDYKITPGFTFKPGLYNLKISFCLSEM